MPQLSFDTPYSPLLDPGLEEISPAVRLSSVSLT